MIKEKSKEAMDVLGETLAVTEPWEDVRIDCIQRLLQELKDEALRHGFTDKQEEITFFKEDKPFLCGHLMFAYMTQKFRLDSPDWSETFVRQFYQAKLNDINSFFDDHKEIVSYYRSKADHLDEVLFVRGRTICPTWLCTQRIDADERFSTLGDYPFSQIIANELTARYINELLEGRLKDAPDDPDIPVLKWTGDSINFYELAYGIHCTGQLNNGNAEIIEVIRALARAFGVEVKRPYRRFAEIKRRKRLSRTQYINSMGTSLNQKLEDEDAYIP